MINRTPRPKFEKFSTKLVEPIYDTVDGKPIYAPAGDMVKVIGKSSNGYYKILILTSKGFVRTLASEAQLGANTVIADTLSTTEDELLEAESSPVGSPLPKILRIYQEYGATFLLWKQRAELADAPGVGKTLQALVAAKRAMEACITGWIDPLTYCYTENFNNRHDELNTHPTERPDWASDYKYWAQTNQTTYGKTTITVYEKQPDYYWAKRFNPVTVVVAPNHLCSMWFKAIREQYPNDHVALATGSGSTKKERMSVLGPGRTWYIVNYEMMRPAPEPKDSDYIEEDITTDFGVTLKNRVLRPDYVIPVTFIDMLNELNPVVVIFDEAHNLKNVKSKQAREAATFAHRAPFRFLLTATPIKREADDLYMQFHVMYPEEYDGHHLNWFTEEYCFYNTTAYGKQNIQLRDSAKRKFWFNRIASLEDAQGEIFATTTKKDNKKYNTSFTKPNLNGYILGRSYKDVGLYLPPVLPANIPVEMDGNIRKIYDKMKATYRATFVELDEEIDINSMIAMIHNLRILTACPNKYRAIQSLIDDNEGPFAIFCEYRPSGEFLADLLGTTFISGDIPSEEREQLVTDLINQGKPIVGMGRVIGTGINAMADCNVIINFEADWTPGERTQRIGRVQRFSPNRVEGQPILLFDVFCTDTMDQHVYEIQKNRGISIRDIITVELGIK